MALENSTFRLIMQEYETRRALNQQQSDNRKQSIYREIPEIQKVDLQIAAVSARMGRILLQDSSADVSSLKESIHTLSEQKMQLLLSHGYPANYLSPIYTCKNCKDTGYINNEKCSCLKQAIVHQVYEQSNIKSHLEQENFSTFRYDYYSTARSGKKPSPRDNIRSVVEHCHTFVEQFPTRHGNILFQGNAGVGKTFLTNCIAKELLDAGYMVVYLTAFQFFDILSKRMFRKEENSTEGTSFQYLMDCDLLIIDDLGTEMINSFVTSHLFQCLNERLLCRRSTIISTNLSLSELSECYSERVVSRIIENYQILNIYGDDIRVKKALGGIK
ncbi:MAG: ATP-binding protein [Lachnospiraceae bacterium]